MWFPLFPHSDSDYARSDAFGTRLSVGTRVDRGCVYLHIVLLCTYYIDDSKTNQIGENVTNASQPRKTPALL